MFSCVECQEVGQLEEELGECESQELWHAELPEDIWASYSSKLGVQRLVSKDSGVYFKLEMPHKPDLEVFQKETRLHSFQSSMLVWVDINKPHQWLTSVLPTHIFISVATKEFEYTNMEPNIVLKFCLGLLPRTFPA